MIDTLGLQLQLINLIQERPTRLWDISIEVGLDRFSDNLQELHEIMLDNIETDNEILNHFNL